jgi:hypothetical protein
MASFLSNRQWTIAVIVGFLMLLLSLGAVLLLFPASTTAQCVTKLTVQRVFTQDAGGTEKTTFAPGEAIRFAAEVNNDYGGYLLGANGAELFIGTDFFTYTHPVDFPPGISTHIWDATAPSAADDYTVAVRAYDSFCGMWVGGEGENGSFSVTGTEETPPPEAEPTITLDPTEGPPGTQLTVQGSGWIPGYEGDTVELYFTVNPEDSWYRLGETTVGNDGTFTATVTIPADAAIEEYYILAIIPEVRTATAFFQVTESTGEPTCPEPTVTVSASSGKPGDTITVQGEDWLPGGTVTVVLVDEPAQFDVGSVSVPGSGAWESSFTLPDAPPLDYWRRLVKIMRDASYG